MSRLGLFGKSNSKNQFNGVPYTDSPEEDDQQLLDFSSPGEKEEEDQSEQNADDESSKEKSGNNESSSDLTETKVDPKAAESDTDSISQTYSRLSKRSTFFERLRNRKKSPSPSPAAADMSNSNSSAGSFGSPSLPPVSPTILKGYRPSTKHKLLDEELASNIRNLLPLRYQLFDDWHLVYSMEQHGISLRTLYQNSNPEYQRQQKRKSKQEKGFADNVVSSMVITTSHSSQYSQERHHGYVLVVKDETNAKFGCFLNEHLRPMEHKRYYGNGECFLWKVETYDPRKLSHSNSYSKEESESKSPEIDLLSDSSVKSSSASSERNPAKSKTPPRELHTRFKAFMYTGINDNIIYSDSGFIAIGSSNGENGLWIDKSLYKGVSCSCDTFGNEILNGKHTGNTGRFKIMGLEVWRIGDYD